ncbi:hypothetical protein AK88_01245 [Plasmodium fragile]|uniref:Dynactin subunit 6 n=1 Tax=Plasmodium fragile TaxID=5857 RepID=A0A0D9QQ38_PLAFR|nr:uncharacterized protein AK88_01245 [Plasmodium fragile]KJP89159.1 hypothetical protein AK88_01245 [Plasmodium fragile]
MSNDKLVKLSSLNLGTRGIGKKERSSPMGGSAHVSNVSHTSSGVEKQSNSFLGWGSAKTSTDASCTSIKSEQLNPYKRVNSLSEYVYKFKRLAHDGGTARGGSNIFRKFNTNRRKTGSSDLWDHSSGQSGEHSAWHFCGAHLEATSQVGSPITPLATPLTSSQTSRADSNSHVEFKSIRSGTSANKEPHILPHQEEGYSRSNNDSPFSDEEDATISSHSHLLQNYKMFKSHMSIDSSPLCSYLNTIGRLETRAHNVGTSILSRVGGTFRSTDLPLGKTGTDMTTLGKVERTNQVCESLQKEKDVEEGEVAHGPLPTACRMDKEEVNNLFKIAIVHNRMISRHKQNTKKKVKKIFYKNRKMCITIHQMSKHKSKQLWRQLRYSEKKILIKNLRRNKNYIYNKKIRKCLFKFFLDNIIPFHLTRNSNWMEARRGPFNRHVDMHILQFALISGFYRGGYRTVSRRFNGSVTNGEPFSPFKSPHKSDTPKKKQEKSNHHAKNEVVRQRITKPSYLLATPGSNVTVGSGNILFPGCYISSQKGNIYIGDNNLFEDNITIINCANVDMYIGNYNIFRSGTCIANVPTIGDHNYFDYKCSISNSSIGCRSYIRANLFGEKKGDDSVHACRYRNIVTDMSLAFVDENVNEIKLRYDHMSSSP